MIISKPGVYEMTAETYHGLCTPAPAISAGFAWKLDHGGPARAWFDSPMNPAFEPQDNTAFDIGRAAHLMFLESDLFDGAIQVVRGFTKDGKPSAGYSSQDAKDQRIAAREAGKTPLLPDELDMILQMRAAMNNAMPDLPFMTAPAFARNGLGGGKAEQSYFWQDRETGVWCKSRPDYVRPFSKNQDVLVDYKTMAPADDLSRYAFSMGWHTRAAWYIDGHRNLTGRDALYWYIAQEKAAPHFVTVAKMDERAIEWGAKVNRRAIRIFADCLASGKWPTKHADTVTIELPRWAEMGLQDRMDAGDFTARAPLRKTDAQKRKEAEISRAVAPHFAA